MPEQRFPECVICLKTQSDGRPNTCIHWCCIDCLLRWCFVSNGIKRCAICRREYKHIIMRDGSVIRHPRRMARRRANSLNSNCHLCKLDIQFGYKLQCYDCGLNFHSKCLGLTRQWPCKHILLIYIFYSSD